MQVQNVLANSALPWEVTQLCCLATSSSLARSYSSVRSSSNTIASCWKTRKLHHKLEVPEQQCCGAGRLSLARRHRLTGTLRQLNQYATSTQNAGTFFDSNLSVHAGSTDNASKRTASDSSTVGGQHDLEKNWLKAHLQSLSSSPKESHLQKADSSVSSNKSKPDDPHWHATRENAKLTLDEEQSTVSADTYGASYRDLIIRCTTFDADGHIMKHSEPVAKSSLCSQHGLQPRDLRKIDSRITNVIPTM